MDADLQYALALQQEESDLLAAQEAQLVRSRNRFIARFHCGAGWIPALQESPSEGAFVIAFGIRAHS